MYASCCERLHSGEASAPTAEALMRSRYSAYAVGDAPYLLATWHSSTRPDSVDVSDPAMWQGLEIVEVERGGMLDQHGIVDFVAAFEREGVDRELRERSRFAREERRWVYVDGEVGEFD